MSKSHKICEFELIKNYSQIDKILKKRFKNHKFNSLKKLPHPFLMKNIKQAATLIITCMKENKKILIVGDYDCDGVCASSICIEFFKELGYSLVSSVIPNRFKHGYGFSKKLFLDVLEQKQDIGLIITVDNGVSSFEVGLMCKQQGIKLIITDHHTLHVDENGKEMPPTCDFLINPKQEACEFEDGICGSLVAWYLCCGVKVMLEELAPNFLMQHNLSNTLSYLLELVGIAVISDVMPLNDINHTICKFSLNRFKKSPRPAFKVFIKDNRLENTQIDSQIFGFKLIPLINSAGRLDDGIISLRFLLASNMQDALKYYSILKGINEQRARIQQDVTSLALNNLIDSKHMVIAYGDSWHEGVLGIVAGRLANLYKKPAFVLCKKEGFYQGSGRSFEDVDLVGSLQKKAYLLERFGGHIGAVGLSIKTCNMARFINEYENKYISLKKDPSILGYLSSFLIAPKLLDLLLRFEPYGNENPLPLFYAELEIKEIKFYPKNVSFLLYLNSSCEALQDFEASKSTNLDAKFNKKFIKAMLFSRDKHYQNLENLKILRFSFSISSDTYGNNPIMLIIDSIY